MSDRGDVRDDRQGRLPRRELLRTIGLTGVATFGAARVASALRALVPVGQPNAQDTFAVTTVNHLSYATPHYSKTRDFYVDLLGARVAWDDGTKCQVDFGPEMAVNGFYFTQAAANTPPTIGHIAFGMPGFWEKKAQFKADLERRKIVFRADGEAGFSINGPSGYMAQPTPIKDPAMFPGSAAPCADAKSSKCRNAYEEGLKHLASLPKPSGRGFVASHFKYIILRVPSVAAERDFYATVLGMKVVSNTAEEVLLQFGRNALILLPSGADGKPSCRQLGIVVESYGEARVRAELDRRGLKPTRGRAGGLTIMDPNGLPIEIAG